jgi:hypothetical protein
MKKYITDIKALAALLMAGAAMTACSSDDNIANETQLPVNPTGKYTMTVNATKGEVAPTRGLYFDNTALKVKWAATDQVSVFPAASNSTLFGTLTATESETGTTTLTGNLTGSVHVNDNLNLLFPRGEWDYTGQKGILLSDENSIEKKYDYAKADVTVAAIDNSHITTTANANFASQQAIVKFILKDKANNADINADKLTISAASNKLVTKKTLVGIGDKIYHSGYTADDGTGTGGEGYAKLVDGDLGTKWCADNGPWFIEFHTASPIKVDGYMLRTGGDTDTNPGRNPKSWVLKGKANIGDATWTTIDSKTDNTEMGAYSNKEYDFTATNPGTYQYFRLDITANQGNGGHMQLSEMKLFTKATEATEINAYGPIVVTPSSATNALTVALRNENAGADTYNLTAVVDGIAYTLGQPSVTFDNGKYYEITAKLTKQTTIDLSTVTTDITVPDGFTLTGTLDGAHKISIADGATVTLDNVTIEGIHSDWFQYAGITCEGDATIILKEGTTNTVNGFDGAFPGIQGAAGKTLTITGTGSLNAASGGNGAGIGSGRGSERACGNIIISGGTITATTAGSYGAGIGSGDNGVCGTITISGGTITATGGFKAAGIGGGESSSCDNITITGGTITATGGDYAAGIGSGCAVENKSASCGTITITDGVTSVTATKGDHAPNSIGKGTAENNATNTCGSVTIDGTIFWDGSAYKNGGGTYLPTSPLVYSPAP